MKTPNIFSSRVFAAVALITVSAFALPSTSEARDWGRDRGRGHGYDHGRHEHRGHPVYYSRQRSTNASVQRALAQRGYYRGPADGDIGPGTRRAIMRYQVEHRLRPTGQIDSSLLRALRIY